MPSNFFFKSSFNRTLFTFLETSKLRLPFDFYEGESELISEFNLEFSSLNFLYLISIEYLELLLYIRITKIILFLFWY